jgi:hypothetical protein
VVVDERQDRDTLAQQADRLGIVADLGRAVDDNLVQLRRQGIDRRPVASRRT